MLQIDTYETVVTLGIRYAMKNEIIRIFHFCLHCEIAKMEL